MKILSPVGNFESLKMAVYNGADEVYLGISDFNARNNIDGFTLSTLQNAVDFAHAYGVKVDLAINILFSDDELQDAVDTLVAAYNIGVDAFIVQDLALATFVHKTYPEIVLHASTQMGIHNLEGARIIEKIGFKRVVLARETPLDEIKRIRENTSLEIEYFVQGALCVCFSGNCYLSYAECNASGNRGRCKQLCRLPYTLQKNGKNLKRGYLLSTKDFNMSSRLDELKSVGVDVLKIEGRARRPFYVASATREYFNFLHGHPFNEENLKLAFNRGFTPGYFDGNGNLISNTQNHVGIKVGKVEKVNYGKNFNEVFLSSTRPLSPKSSFKFFSQGEEKQTLSAYDLKEVSKGKYRLTTTQKVSVGDSVHLIVDAMLEEQTLKLVQKRKIKIFLDLKENQPIKATCKLENKQIELSGEVCQTALSQPLSKNEFVTCFAKHDIFEGDVSFEHFDNIFLSKKQLNDFRRSFFDKVFDALTKSYRHNIKSQQIETHLQVQGFENFQFVENLDENFTSANIIYSPETYSLENVEKFCTICASFGKKPFLDTPNFALKKDIELLSNIISKTKIAIVANNYYALSFDTEIVVGAGMNIYNSYSANVLDKKIICAESDLAPHSNFPLMTLRHCPMKSHLGCTCDNCKFSNDFTYLMDNGKVLKLKRKKLSTCTFYLEYK